MPPGGAERDGSLLFLLKILLGAREESSGLLGGQSPSAEEFNWQYSWLVSGSRPNRAPYGGLNVLKDIPKSQSIPPLRCKLRSLDGVPISVGLFFGKCISIGKTIP